MITVQTIVLISDNSGAVYGKCIRVMKSSQRLGAKGGDIISLAIKKVFIKKTLKKSKRIIKGQICRGVVLRTIRFTKRWGHFIIYSGSNSICIVNEYLLPLATRIFGPINIELRQLLAYKKILSLGEVSI